MIHLHWFRFDHGAGVNRYYACRCGSRKVVCPVGYGASPIDKRWLETGMSTPEPKMTPPGPSGVSRARMEPPPDTSWVAFEWIGP